jgi:hypothetical protein
MINVQEFFKIFKNFLTNPAQTTRELKTKDYSVNELLVLIFIIGTMGFIISLLLSISSKMFYFDIVNLVTNYIMNLVMVAIGIVIGSFIISQIAKLLGGKPIKLQNYMYIQTLLGLVFYILYLIPAIMMVIPGINIIASILILIIALYALYCNVILIREVFELSTLKAIAVLVIIGIILSIIAVIISMIFAFLFFSALTNAAAVKYS